MVFLSCAHYPRYVYLGEKVFSLILRDDRAGKSLNSLSYVLIEQGYFPVTVLPPDVFHVDFLFDFEFYSFGACPFSGAVW